MQALWVVAVVRRQERKLRARRACIAVRWRPGRLHDVGVRIQHHGVFTMNGPRAALTGLLSLLLVASPSLLPGPPSVAHAVSCGEWRWDVKTLSDPDRRDVNFVRRRIRIQRLRRLDSPGPYDGMPRTGPVETQVYQVRASVREATVEDDSDIHLVIAQRGAPARTMIVEFPDPRCVDSAFHRRQIHHARDQMLNNCGPISSSSFTDLKGHVTIRGVGFWDEIHGQTGVAPNGIELHPVLSIRGTCSHHGAGGGGGGGSNCDPAYPTVCISSPPPDLDCGDISYRNFRVRPADPHNFDADNDGIGCET